MPRQFGFTPGKQPMDDIEAMQRALRKNYEWGHSILIASFGVDKAFDQLEEYAMEKALEKSTAREGGRGMGDCGRAEEFVDQRTCRTAVGAQGQLRHSRGAG